MKYLMHLANRDGLSEDAEGVERADMADAVSYAIQPAQCIICDDLLGYKRAGYGSEERTTRRGSGRN